MIELIAISIAAIAAVLLAGASRSRRRSAARLARLVESAQRLAAGAPLDAAATGAARSHPIELETELDRLEPPPAKDVACDGSGPSSSGASTKRTRCSVPAGPPCASSRS